MGLPTATVQMLGPDGITHVATGLGTGPVDAAYKAIDSLIRVPVRPAHIGHLLGIDAGTVWPAWTSNAVSMALAVCPAAIPCMLQRRVACSAMLCCS